MPAEVTDATFADEVLGSDIPVLVDFWAEWCGPCHKLNPILEDLAGEYAGRLRIVKLDADANPETVRAYNVMAMPTLAVFRKGEVIGQLVGMRAKFTLRNELDEILSRES
ncbi:MAG: thioredoxin [Actinobacteria bacterium]|nr:MAG: thioredoxin [Actinomycetota bacterium]